MPNNLEKEFEKTGVEPVTPTGGESDPPKKAEETKVVEGDDKGGKGKSDNRLDENYFRELLRKSDERQEQLIGRIESGFNKISEALSTGPAAPAVTPLAEPQPTGNPLDKFSVDQLNIALAEGKIPDEQKAGYQNYISQRIAKEVGAATAKDIIQEHDRETTALGKRRQALETAQERFPDLGNKNSKFYKSVDKMIQQRGKAWLNNNPMAILDAANAVAVAQNVKPARRQIESRPANRRDNFTPVGLENDEPMLSDDQQSAIEKKLGPALGKNPDGTPRKFNREEIAKGHQYYTKTGHLRIK